MLTLKTLRDNPEMVVAKLAKKNFDASAIVAEIIELDTLRRSLQTESDALKSTQNQIAARIGQYMKQGLKDEAEKAKAEVAGIKEKYNDMIAKPEENGQFTRTPYGFGATVKRPGYPTRYAKDLIKQTGDKFILPTDK